MPTPETLETFDLSEAKPQPRYRPTTPVSSVLLPKGFPEARLFALLKSLFGRPNGAMSFTIERRGDPDAPFKYEYYLAIPDGSALSIVRSWLNLEIRGIGRTISQGEIVRMITHNFELHKEKVQQAFESLEVFRLVINPHARHRAMMRWFEGELKKVEVSEPDYPNHIVCSTREIRSFGKQVQGYLRNMQNQNLLAVSLVMESAYTAESLLNLLIAVLKKPILTANANLLKEALFEGWKDKIERLPLHCDHIATAPDLENPAVKAIERVFKRRNRIAHSYPDPEDLCAEKIWFDDRIPVLPNCGPYITYQMGVDALLPSRQEALECPSLVQAFTEYLFGLLSEQIRDELRQFSKSNPIGYSEVSRRFGVPFGEAISMALIPNDAPAKRSRL